jgi:hypothetical protein
MSNDLWQELSGYHIYPIENGTIGKPEVLFNHSKNFMIFDIQVCFALASYKEIIDFERKSNSKMLSFKHCVYKQNTIIRLITGFEVYLVDSFKNISNSLSLEKLDPVKLVDFIKEFRSQNDYFNALTKPSQPITLYDLLPERIDLQQKDKCRKAYSLINIDFKNMPAEDQAIFSKIFDKSNGYMQMRHQIVHRGIAQTHDESINAYNIKPINVDYITAIALDIANFVYNIELEINSKYPKSNYPEIYFKTGKGPRVESLDISPRC